MSRSKEKQKIFGGAFWLRAILVLIFAAYVVFILGLRTVFFKGDTIMFNLYEVDNGAIWWVRLLKMGVVFGICFIIIEASTGLVKLSEWIKNNSLKTTFLLLGNILKYIAGIAFVLISLGIFLYSYSDKHILKYISDLLVIFGAIVIIDIFIDIIRSKKISKFKKK